MKYKHYPTHKDSGIDWLGKVPAHWDLVRFRFMFFESKERNGSTPVGNMLSVSGYRGIEEKEYEHEGKKRADEELESYRVVRPNQLAVNTMWLNHCGLGVSSLTGHVSPAYSVYDITSELNPAYAHHLLRSDAYVDGYKTYLYGIRPNSFQIKDDDFRSIPVLVPSTAEQQSIAKFLDRETTRIDALIEKKQRLIELLKEKRQAVITQAVTKGLDPNVPMKDSGVEWLGEVPGHWVVTRLKYLVESYEQGWSPQCESRQADESEYGVLKVGCVNGGFFSPNENKALPAELAPRSRYSLVAGDFLISRANTKELVGSAAVVEQDWPNLLLCDKLYRLRFWDEINASHICNYMMSHPVREQLELSATGASDSMQNIGQGVVLELSIPMPPPEEAAALVQHLKKTLARLKTIEEKSDESVKLLKEHRSALITAAVTGQIDVRNTV